MWIVADLTFDTDAEAREAERLAREGKLTGVSVDLAVSSEEIEIREVDDEGFPTDWLRTIHEGEIIGATQVPMPAFADAHIEFTESGPVVWLAPEGTETSDKRFISEGALSWRDPAPLMFQDQTTPGHDGAVFVGNLTNFRRVGSLVAFGGEYPKPALGMVSKPSVEGGDLVGHGAAWGVCHTSFPNACVTAPTSESGYAYAGSALRIYKHPRGDFHAPLHLNMEEARAWYDAHCELVGQGACGEDPYGIWVNAQTTLPDGDVFLSGDWRPDPDGNLELISFLVVDKPGFPTALVANESQVALVAAGVVTESDPVSALLGRVERLEAVIAAQDLLDALV